MVQNAIAGATSSVQNVAAGPPFQGYNPYSQGPVYTSPSGGTAYPSEVMLTTMRSEVISCLERFFFQLAVS